MGEQIPKTWAFDTDPMGLAAAAQATAFWVQRVVYAGIDVAHLNDIDDKGGMFNADLHVWLRYGGANADPTHIEFPGLQTGASRAVFDPAKPTEQGKLDGLNYRLYRFT